MPFEIIRNDITKVAADAVVNTANPAPVIGAGTDFAVHKAAGPKLLKAREKIGEIPVGCCRSTKAYDLPAKYVLHTVSPVWQDGEHGELSLLKAAYETALAEAKRLRCRSVAFPLMAAGSYGFPMDQALSVAISAFTDFLLTNEMQITLVIFNGKAFSLASGLFSDLKSYIDENYARRQSTLEYASGRRRPGAFHSSVSPDAEEAASFALSSAEDKKSPAVKEPFRPLASDQLLTGAFAPPAAEKKADIVPSSAKAEKKTASKPSYSLAAEQTAPRPAAVKAAPKAASLNELLKQAESSFPEHLLRLIDEKGFKDSEVYHRAQVSRQLFNKIINKKYYPPGKNTVIQLALALELDLAQTQLFLSKAGYALTRASKADLVVQYYIERKQYSIPQINIALFDCGLPPLKTGLGA